MAVAKRGTLLIVSGPRQDPLRKHLHVVCSDPDDDGRTVIVAICSLTEPHHDQTCVLAKGDHEFIVQESYVFYAKAKITTVKALEAGIEQKVMEQYEDLRLHSFLKVAAGICRSPHTPRGVKKFMNCGEPTAEI